MFVLRIGGYAAQLVLDDLGCFLFDAIVVLADDFIHAVPALAVGEVGKCGNGFIALFLGFDGGGIDDDLRMKHLLLHTLVEVIGDGSDEIALG